MRPAWLEPGRAQAEASSREFDFTPGVAEGAAVGDGSLLGSVATASGIAYQVLAPPGLTGIAEKVRPAGPAPGAAVLATVSGTPVSLTSSWPVRLQGPTVSGSTAARRC